MKRTYYHKTAFHVGRIVWKLDIPGANKLMCIDTLNNGRAAR
jgi:hypothetical protein